MSDTKDEILARMLANIDPTYDRSEGSFIFDVLAAEAIELEAKYAEQEATDKAFADTATSTKLSRLVYSRAGMIRKPATYATTTVTITGAVGATIAIGDKVASDTVTFSVTAGATVGAGGTVDVATQCDTIGSAGNVPAGAIKYYPVTLPGLTAVTNAAAVSNGYDAESDTDLRQRYFDFIRTPATSGNASHYRNWAKEVTGAGDAKVYPIWNGNGTVKVVIIDSLKTGADAGLVTSVATYIEEQRPVGATVTVESAAELAINVSFTAVKDMAYTDQQRQANVEAAIRAYLTTIAYVQNTVSYAQIGNAILDAAGISDYSALTVNGGTVNVPISATAANTQVAVLGVVTIA